MGRTALSPFWYLNLFILHELETWTSDRSWKKEIIDDMITMVTRLRCNMRTRNGFKKKSRVIKLIWSTINDTNQRASFSKFQLHTMSGSWKEPIFSMQNWISRLWLVLRNSNMFLQNEFKFRVKNVTYRTKNVSTAHTFKLGLPSTKWFGIRWFYPVHIFFLLQILRVINRIFQL